MKRVFTGLQFQITVCIRIQAKHACALETRIGGNKSISVP